MSIVQHVAQFSNRDANDRIRDLAPLGGLW